ncbi:MULTISPECIES: NAD(P)/FAD-dependent oxidoreductase [Aeromicrobium]|nr:MULTISPECIES: FAD-dependent oxidoreductase [Aeromicrobium]
MSAVESCRIGVVGSGLGGFRVAADLRRLGHTGPLVVFGAETHPPYDRPPLSKQILLGDWTVDEARLADDAELEALSLDLRPGAVVRAVTPGRVHLASGSTEDFDVVVVATGAEARMPDFVPDHPLIHRLRTLDDAMRLRSALPAAESLVVVGGGFIGGEVAAAARVLGVDVTIVEAMPTLFHRALGAEAGEYCSELHRRHGVRVLSGSPVRGLSGADGGVTVTLEDGTHVTADLALVGLGASLNTGVLDGLGLDVVGGVLCDGSGAVEGLDGVYALGDVARWRDELTGLPTRREHWSTAGDQAAIVAHTILGLPVPDYLRQAPYFWSDQHGIKIQVIGRTEMARTGGWLEQDADSGSAVYGYHDGESLVAVATFGSPRLIGKYRPLVAEGMLSARSSAVS